MIAALQILLVASLICWGLSWLFFMRLRFLRMGDREMLVGRSVSLIIPARNEERNLGRLLASIAPERDLVHEIIVVDDHSEDGTARVAEEHGATVQRGLPLPDRWLGKPWACAQGARCATGDWLLFMDADTFFEGGGVRSLLALADSPEEVHSICPYHVVRRPHEELSGFFNVIMALGMNAFSWRGTAANDIGLFGQTLLISRSSYVEVGGHETVKGEVLENFHLARSLSDKGKELFCWLGRGVVRMRMFPSGFKSLIEGWSKGAVAGATNTPLTAVCGVAIWLSGLSLSTVGLLLGLILGGVMLPWMMMGYGLFVLQVWFRFRAVGSFSALSAVFFPAHLLFYNFVFFRAWLRQKRGGSFKWKGRYVA